MSRQPERRGRADAASPLPFVGMAWMAGLAFMDVFSYQFLPWWGCALLVALWLPLFWASVAWWTPRPQRSLWPPAVGTGAWLLAVLLAG